MIVIAGLLTGALWGAALAQRRKGSRLDMAQYSAAFAIAFAIVGLFVTLLVDRLM